MGSTRRWECSSMEEFETFANQVDGKFLTYSIEDVDPNFNKDRMMAMLGKERFYPEYLCKSYIEPIDPLSIEVLLGIKRGDV